MNNLMNEERPRPLTLSEIERLFPNHSVLNSAKIELSDGYVNFLFKGDCVGLQMKLKGNSLIECQLDSRFVYHFNNDKLIIYSMTNTPLPKEIFKFYGELSIVDSLAVDVFGNSHKLNVKKDFMYNETPIRLNDTIATMSGKIIGNMQNINSTSYKFKKGVKIVPKGTFKSFLETQDSKVAELVETNRKAKKERIVPIDKLIQKVKTGKK